MALQLCSRPEMAGVSSDPVDCGEKRRAPRATRAGSCILQDVSWPVVEGANGEIQRSRETIGGLAGQGKPEVVHCHGRLKAAEE